MNPLHQILNRCRLTRTAFNYDCDLSPCIVHCPLG